MDVSNVQSTWKFSCSPVSRNLIANRIRSYAAATETFIDNVSRRAFDNFADFEELYGDRSEMKELPYPRASNARHLPARIKRRLEIGDQAKPGRVA